MLRVHPIVHTPDPRQLAAGLVALGLVPAAQDAGRLVLNAGGGRITLKPSNPGEESTILGFEVGDLDVFAQRTRESGTAAEVVNSPDGAARVQVSTPSVTFHADLGERELAAVPVPALTVVALWRTPGPAGAAEVLANIGAKERAGTPDAAAGTDRPVQGSVDFLAKNGGVVTVRPGPRHEFEVAFEYAGNVAELRERAGAAGLVGRVAGADAERHLIVELGPGRPLIIAERAAVGEVAVVSPDSADGRSAARRPSSRPCLL